MQGRGISTMLIWRFVPAFFLGGDEPMSTKTHSDHKAQTAPSGESHEMNQANEDRGGRHTKEKAEHLQSCTSD